MGNEKLFFTFTAERAEFFAYGQNFESKVRRDYQKIPSKFEVKNFRRYRIKKINMLHEFPVLTKSSIL